jgi:hypothetical protein
MSKSDGGVSDQVRVVVPQFKRVNPVEGARYIDGMVAYCLSNHPEIVTWLRGSIDPDMLEFTAEWRKRSNLARRGGTYKDSHGTLCPNDQTLEEYKEALMDEVRATDPNVEWTEAQITKVLYPKVTAKARADKRARLNQAAQALLGKAMLLWPAPDVRDLMAADLKLTAALETVDLIAFIKALKEFCLEGTGNVDNNIRVAEDHITNLKMSRTRFTQYVKEFKAAAENLATCGSTFTQERIVTLFIKNLDQTEFFNFFVNFLNPRNSLNELKTGTLQAAITLVQEYYTAVIRVVDDDAASSLSNMSGGVGGGGHSSPVKVTNAKGLKDVVTSSKHGGEFLVTQAVLAAFVRSASKEKVGNKRKGNPDAAGAAGSTAGSTPPPKKGKCFAFEKGETCKFGANCKFQH